MSKRNIDFSCKCCGCGTITQETYDLFVCVCNALGFKPIVSSAYRCESHNSEVGGDPHSLHTRGMALDLIVPDDIDVDYFANVCLDCGAGGIGRYYSDQFVHIDTGERRDWSVL